MRRLYTHWVMSHPKIRIRRSRKNNLKKKVKSSIRERYGIKIPRNTREVLLLDKHNGNTLWAEAISKERTYLEEKGVFKFHLPVTKIPSGY